MLLAVALLATPSAFALLPRDQAGLLAARVFGHEAAASLLLAVVLAVLERRHAARSGDGALPAGLLLAFGALFCTVLGYYALQPMIAAARSGQGRFTFMQLHLASTVLFGLKAALVLALAWRAAPPGLSRSEPS